MKEDHISRKVKLRHELTTLPTVANAVPNVSGVLLSDRIAACVAEFGMIEPFSPDRLRAAGYELSIGDEVCVGGEIQPLKDAPGDNVFTLRPFEVAVIKIHERLNLPRNIIGRWNIKVGLAYKGLVWVGGPQVDPGWVGNLSCPIYNLSDKPVILRLHDPIAVIDFVVTTPFSEGKCREFERPPKRVTFDDYTPEDLRSALVKGAQERIDNFEAILKESESRFSSFISFTYAVLGILVAALAIQQATSGSTETKLSQLWNALNTALALVALWIASAALRRTKIRESPSKRAVRQ
jgi:dCTP deaminase